MNEPVCVFDLPVKATLHWQESFAAWLHQGGKRPNTISGYLQDVRHFGQFFEAENGQAFEPGLLNAIDVKKYFRLQDEALDVKPTSRNRRLASLKVLVRWAVEEGWLEYDPTVTIKRLKVEFMPRDRSDDEMARCEAVVNAGSQIRCGGDGHAWLALRDRIIWWAFVYTGCRIHEVAGLNVSSLDWDQNKIEILGKGGKKATVVVSSQFMTMLAAWLDLRPASAGEALFTGWNGKRLTRGQVWRRIKMIGAAAGIPDLKPHDIRHWYAYHLREQLNAQGVSEEKALDAVRRQLRHGDAKTTLGYFRVRESQIRAAVEA